MQALWSPKIKFTDNNDEPLAGGKLYSYAGGTSTPLATYTEYSGTFENTNPVVLDANGEANIWISNDDYKFELKDANDTTLWVVDNFSTLRDLSISSSKLENGAVTTLKIADGAITSIKIDDGAVVTAKLQNGAVTDVKTSFTPPKITRYGLLAPSEHTLTAGTKWIKVRLLGGGGGGGGGMGVDGGDGGDTDFGDGLLVAGGGGGGKTSSNFGDGGSPSANTIGTPDTETLVVLVNINGTKGFCASVGGIGVLKASGRGAPSVFGGGGAEVLGDYAGGDGVHGYGGGGGGGGVPDSEGSRAAGGGASGGYIEANIYNPKSSYAMSIGAAGLGALGMTKNGGRGGRGTIIVEEHFF